MEGKLRDCAGPPQPAPALSCCVEKPGKPFQSSFCKERGCMVHSGVPSAGIQPCSPPHPDAPKTSQSAGPQSEPPPQGPRQPPTPPYPKNQPAQLQAGSDPQAPQVPGRGCPCQHRAVMLTHAASPASAQVSEAETRGEITLAISLDIAGANTKGRQRSGKQIRDTKSQHQANPIKHP